MRLVSLLRSIYKSIYLLFLLLAATVDAKIRRPTPGPEGAVWIHEWCRRIVTAMGIEYRVTGALPTNGAVVSNHLSYLDILLYSAIAPFIMVAKKDVRSWPLLGWLTAQAGTVYVQRSEDVAIGAPKQTHSEVNRWMAEAYAADLPVLFFPEGTTTDGSSVLPFRRGLFHSVLSENVPLRVAAISFKLVRRGELEPAGTDICFVGDDLFAPHIFGFLGLPKVIAAIEFGEEVLERDDRFVLSQTAHAAVTQLHKNLAFDTQGVALGRVRERGLTQPSQDLLHGPVQ
jgi:1-acyl-sn-glycerol-3-phosphate acyltransferase